VSPEQSDCACSGGKLFDAFPCHKSYREIDGKLFQIPEKEEMEDSAAQYRAGLREWLHIVDEADRRFFTTPAGAKEVDLLALQISHSHI
jgi:hypothetical protein